MPIQLVEIVPWAGQIVRDDIPHRVHIDIGVPVDQHMAERFHLARFNGGMRAPKGLREPPRGFPAISNCRMTADCRNSSRIKASRETCAHSIAFVIASWI